MVGNPFTQTLALIESKGTKLLGDGNKHFSAGGNLKYKAQFGYHRDIGREGILRKPQPEPWAPTV